MSESPYISRLKAEIAQPSDPPRRGQRRAELAACRARHGDFEDAEREIGELRAEFGDGRSGQVTVLIMCAEAQLIYYRNLGEQARDRMMRAQLLSVAGRDAALSALTSAWLAHICFNLHRHEEMARAAKTSLDTITKGDLEAAARLSLTLGDALYAADQAEIGNRWYGKAHVYATKLGDHATMAALTYNRAAMGTFMARAAAAAGHQGAADVPRLNGEVRNAVNYQAIAQLVSLQPLLDYAVASAHILGAKFAEAAPLLTSLLQAEHSTSPIERSAALRCDLALCYAKSGQTDRARREVEDISMDDIGRCTPDDQVVALAALSAAAEGSGLATRAADAQSRLAVALSEHARGVAALRSSLSAFATPEALDAL
jgi:hypothetical protein